MRIKKCSETQKTPRHKEESSCTRRRTKEDQSLRHLISITLILSVFVVVGLIYLAHLLLVADPDLQYCLPYLQRYININEDVFSSWQYKWLDSSQQQETITITVQSDASNLNFDASNKNNDFTIASEGERENNHVEHQDEMTTQTPSSIYIIPNSMAHIGDKSEEYARFRQDWDERYPPNSPERSLRAVKELLASGNDLDSIYNRLQPPPLPLTTSKQKLTNDDKNSFDNNVNNDNINWDYDIYECPDDPPPGYPREYKTIDILRHWPPSQSLPVGVDNNNNLNSAANKSIEEGNDTINTAPITAHLGLCIFDYSRDYEKAMRYRSKEMPFVVRNDPSVAETVERWNDENYRRELFSGMRHSNGNDHSIKKMGDDVLNDDSIRKVYHRAEQSITNQILFRHAPKKKRPPTFNKYPSSNKGEEKKGNFKHDQSPNGTKSPPMPPRTKLVTMTYDQWYERAMKKEDNSTIDAKTGIQYYDSNLNRNKSSYYYYFRLVGCGEKDDCERNSTEYLFDELPFFQPKRETIKTPPEDTFGTPEIIPESSSSHSNQESLYLVQPEKQRGIHCRFGMPGMIAANHYDASRNAITVLGGSRRYIISRPKQCSNLGLYPVGHASSRHSKVDWTTAYEDYKKLANYDHEKREESETLESSWLSSDAPSWIDYRKSLSLLANNATSTEVILQAGDVLYLPSYWFHYIISLTTNMQCNTRSGREGRDDQIMADCGFPPPRFKSRL